MQKWHSIVLFAVVFGVSCGVVLLLGSSRKEERWGALETEVSAVRDVPAPTATPTPKPTPSPAQLRHMKQQQLQREKEEKRRAIEEEKRLAREQEAERLRAIEAAKEAARTDGIVSMAEYNRLETGMSYSEVMDIIGPGEEMAKNDFAGTITVMYVWKNPNGSNMNAMFQDDRLIQRAQLGLD